LWDISHTLFAALIISHQVVLIKHGFTAEKGNLSAYSDYIKYISSSLGNDKAKHYPGFKSVATFAMKFRYSK